MSAIDGYEEDKSTDWTHGAPGYCLLLLKAYEVFGHQKYLDQAKETAEKVIWPRRAQRKGLGLARGIAGMAYSLMALARVDTEDDNGKMWQTRAKVSGSFNVFESLKLVPEDF
jgi:lantibiotic modifying enzyme